MRKNYLTHCIEVAIDCGYTDADYRRATAREHASMNRFYFFGLVLLLAALIAGCGPTRVVSKPTIVEVPKYIREPIPEDLIGQCTYNEPDPACWRDGHREFCNGQLLIMRQEYQFALRQCDKDKTRLRALNISPPKKAATP